MTRWVVRKMEYEELRLLKQSEKSTVLLMREKDGEKVFIKKILRGRQNLYLTLLNFPHPYLPKLYEVSVSDDTTAIIEEYIEGEPLGGTELSEKRLLHIIKELCSVLEFLHEKDIIHRDIKPSNLILAKDGHIRLIDFDAARMKKDNLEQDTRLLGTRGYAPPEQYGFSQTDERADIYSLGVTINQLLGEKAQKPQYKRVIKKCTNLNPDKRYQSVQQVKRAFFHRRLSVLYGSITLVLLVLLLWGGITRRPVPREDAPSGVESSVSASPAVLPAPENPHWDSETGLATWNNVPESGKEGEIAFKWRLYWKDTETPPDSNETWFREGRMAYSWDNAQSLPTFDVNVSTLFLQNGFYYFSVCAEGDGVRYTDSPYVMSSKAFHYTGQSSPPLPAPAGLAWKLVDEGAGQQHFATWSNLSDYADLDSFNVRIYNQEGEQVCNNIWTKKEILSIGHGGIWFSSGKFEPDGGYRFTVQVQTSRPNEYQSTSIPTPIPEEYYSPWYYPSGS